MPDLLAGSTVRPGDTPVTVTNTQAGSFTFTITTFGVAIVAGTYVDCGVSFVAGTTGRAKIDFSGAFDNDTSTAFTIMAPVVRAGATVGSGAVVVAANDDDALSIGSTVAMRVGAAMLVTGLTAGTTYNVRLEHRVSAGTGTLLRRRVIVTGVS